MFYLNKKGSTRGVRGRLRSEKKKKLSQETMYRTVSVSGMDNKDTCAIIYTLVPRPVSRPLTPREGRSSRLHYLCDNRSNGGDCLHHKTNQPIHGLLLSGIDNCRCLFFRTSVTVPHSSLTHFLLPSLFPFFKTVLLTRDDSSTSHFRKERR